MWELDLKEGWVRKNWCFWTMVVEKTLDSPLDCQEDQISESQRKSTLNIHWEDWCWSWSSNPLATWCKEPTHGKDPDAGKDWGNRRRRQQRMRWLDSITNSMDMNLSKLWTTVENRGAWHATVHGVTKTQTWFSNWTKTRSKERIP